MLFSLSNKNQFYAFIYTFDHSSIDIIIIFTSTIYSTYLYAQLRNNLKIHTNIKNKSSRIILNPMIN